MFRRQFPLFTFTPTTASTSIFRRCSATPTSTSMKPNTFPCFRNTPNLSSSRRFNSSSSNTTNNNNSSKFKTFLKTYWFPMLIPVVVVGCISNPTIMHPTEGLLQSGHWRSYLVPIMFLASGLSVPVDLMLASIFAFQAHAFTQITSLFLLPLMGVAFVKMVDMIANKLIPSDRHNPLSKEFLLGMTAVAMLPTTIGLSTAVAKAIGGDVPLTIVNAILGNLLGILVTPFMFVNLTGYKASMDGIDVIKKLSVTVVLPLLIGLFIRAKILPKPIANTISPFLSPLQQLCILTFLSTVVSHNADTVKQAVKIEDVPLLLSTIVIMYGVFFHVSLLLSRFVPFQSEAQRIAGLLSGTQKTAAMGVSIMSLLFEGDPALPIVLLPLLMYHPAQVGASTVFAVNAMRRGWTKVY